MNRIALPPTPHFLRLTRRLALASLALAGPFSLAAEPPAAAPAAGASAPGGKAALTVTTVQARPANWPITLSANGSIAAWQEASVGAESQGLRLVELRAQVGDTVQKGQVLATFAAETIEADLALARAALAEARANATEAQANGERARAVSGTGALSAQQVGQYLSQEQAALARVASAQAQVDLQTLRLRQTQVLAPDNGTIAARNATVGAVVSSGTELFRLIRQGRLEWRAEVTAAELARIRPGMAVKVSAPGGATSNGRVRLVAPTVDPATRNGLVYVDLAVALGGKSGSKSDGSGFKPGMFARGELDLGQSSALSLPQTAVVQRDGFAYVYRVGPDQRVSQRKVQTGRTSGDRIEVLSGVQADDAVVASGGSFLSDGDLVKVVAAPAAAGK